MAAPEVPDWTRPIQLFAESPTGELIPVLVDADGQLYIVIQGELVGITGDVNVTQAEKDREIQGKDGTTKRTVAVDASGRIIMVPYGTTQVAGTATVTQAAKDREIQGADGVTLRTIVVDSAGRIIMVPYGVTEVSGTATVTQAAKDREVQGADGATLRTLVVDANGQLIMVPRGQSGNYMAVDASGFLTTILKGLDGATLRTVVVDANGNIVAVVKGEYAGTLKNLAVDASGRMIMIPTDPADIWGNAISMGNAELAARITGLGGFDRRGNAIWLWDFEDGLGKWVKDLGAGTGAAVDIGTISRNGAYAAKLTAPSDGDLTVILTTDLAFPILSKMGFEVSFTLAQYTTKVEADLMVYDGTNQYPGLIRYDYGNTRFEYQASDGSWTVLESSLNLDREANCYHTMKIVVDPSTGKYVRAILDDTEHDIDTAAMKSVASALAPHLVIQVKHLGTSGQLPAIYIDSIIVTQNEPANA